ncbi:hypothetical protein Bpfe_024335 [Biomphalaria pfeifferi]|uniref:Uncharacterized protein n=1 Tax=Biomphalaria pfeifferi TaxID=112525 RepID=A0AAD8F0W6_BIOPF|nr:hypothetical protein Bpfe_024335 [Biomphalaria pfeifferi]
MKMSFIAAVLLVLSTLLPCVSAGFEMLGLSPPWSIILLVFFILLGIAAIVGVSWLVYYCCSEPYGGAKSQKNSMANNQA